MRHNYKSSAKWGIDCLLLALVTGKAKRFQFISSCWLSSELFWVPLAIREVYSILAWNGAEPSDCGLFYSKKENLGILKMLKKIYDSLLSIRLPRRRSSSLLYCLALSGLFICSGKLTKNKCTLWNKVMRYLINTSRN
jgi:hypothetical protein